MKAAEVRTESVVDRPRPSAVCAGLAPRPYGLAFADARPGLTIGHADDPAEREADRIAERALRGDSPVRAGRAAPALRRACADCEEEDKRIRRDPASGSDRHGGGAAPPAVTSLLAQPGRALDPAARSFFEGRFGRSFGAIAVHDGPAADVAARSIGARAFTAGSHVAFARGQYDPRSEPGLRLLGHELAHVAQGDGVMVRRAPDPKVAKGWGELKALEPASSSIDEIRKVYAQLQSDQAVAQFFVVDGNTLKIYDKLGKFKSSFNLNRPGLIDIKGYYVGSPFGKVGWYWLFQNKQGAIVLSGETSAIRQKMEEKSNEGEALRTFSEELGVVDWIAEADYNRFVAEVEAGWIAMAVLNMPPKTAKTAPKKEGPILNLTLPDWFKQLKTKVEATVAAHRAADKANPNLPDSLSFYGSDKVQAGKGADAWTIQANKSGRWGAYTVLKAQWDAASDKDAYARQVTDILYGKVKLILDNIKLGKEENKELTEIDGTGQPKKKGSKWGWAVALRKRIEAQLAAQKLSEKDAKDFPDKLTLATVGEGDKAVAHLRVWVYDSTEPKPGKPPDLRGGTLPSPLAGTDRAEDWVAIVRKAADALRRGAVTTTPREPGEGGKEGGDPAVQPPYPSYIRPINLNPDLTTATIAENTFRMVIDVDSSHGANLLHRTTIHMGLSIGYSWAVYPLPAELKELKTASREQGQSNDLLIAQTTDYARKNRESLGTPKDTWSQDRDWDQEIEMSDLGEGDFYVVATAAIGYPEDWNMKRQASVAALPFSVLKAEDMARTSAFTDSDALAKLKAQFAAEKDEKKKDFLGQQIKDLEFRENNDIKTLTEHDLKDTETLLEKAKQLQKFVQDDRDRGLKLAGGKNYDPIIMRLAAADEKFPPLYNLIRQIFDFRYDDVTAVGEYVKLIEKQKTDLQHLQIRTDRLTTKNDKLRKDKHLPPLRAVAGLVKEDDGNLVPLLVLVGHHKDSQPELGKYRMMAIDVTIASPSADKVTYVGDEQVSKDPAKPAANKLAEEWAVDSAFEAFGDENEYGNGEIFYRVPQKGFQGKVPSRTTPSERLGQVLAVLGIILLIAGAVLSAGTLAGPAAVGIGALATALGIAAGVAGAALAARNIYKRVEKGTFELDAAFALDVIAIIGAFAQVAGTVGKLSAAGRLSSVSRGVGAAQRVAQVQRLGQLLLVYDLVELGGNAVLVYMKVQEDVAAVDALVKEKLIDADRAEELKQQIALEALQTGAMLAYASFSKAGEIHGAVKAKVENSRYRSYEQRGWIKDGKPTDTAPPFLREPPPTTPGKVSSKAAQGEQAWKETKTFGMSEADTVDKQHKLTITEKGRIIRCSDYCTDLRLKYREVLETDPGLAAKMTELEGAAQAAAKSKSKSKADKTSADAAKFEHVLKKAERDRKYLFGMDEAEIDEALATIDAPAVTGGPATGMKIGGKKIPRGRDVKVGRKKVKMPRRRGDVDDFRTEAELRDAKTGFSKAMDRIGKVMGRKISDIPELRAAWDSAVADVLGKRKIGKLSKAEMLEAYAKARKKFWDHVRADPKAKQFLKDHGFELPGESGAALAVLGPKGKETNRGKITDQERRISLDHIEEKAQGENWQKALDADNLELMFHNANSWKEIVQMKFGMRDEPQ